MSPPRLAVIPVAGLATRAQPLCRSIPKEMLPLGRRPVIHHVVEELFRGGATDFILITGERSRAIESYFATDELLDRELARKELPVGWHGGDRGLGRCSFQSVRQDSPKGVADAVHRARPLLDDRPFFLHMGDSVLSGDDDYAGRMAATWEEHAASVVVLVHPMDPETVSSHGLARPVGEASHGVFEVEEIVEKPSPAEADSPYGLTGRYLIAETMVEEALEEEPRISPTGAFGAILPARLNGPVMAVCTRSAAELHDAGTVDGYLRAQASFALRDAKLGEQIQRALRGAGS